MDKIEFGLYLKSNREQFGASQKQIADFFGLSQDYINSVEEGQSHLSVEQLEELSCLYGCDFQEFINSEIYTKPIHTELSIEKMTDAELKTIAVVNRIAKNSEYMATLLGKAV